MSYHLNMIQHKKKGDVHIMGTTFIVITTLKLAAMGGLGISLASGLQYFHEFKLNRKKKGGDEDGVGESLREKTRFIN
jgi:mannose/fructose/N-acetylgalactosamine-specific phosphotransferase system component IIC